MIYLIVVASYGIAHFTIDVSSVVLWKSKFCDKKKNAVILNWTNLIVIAVSLVIIVGVVAIINWIGNRITC